MNRVLVCRGLSLASYLGLITLLMLWIIWLGEVPRERISISLLLAVLPLLLPLRGILAGHAKPIIWGTLLSLPYSVHAGMLLWDNPPNLALGLPELLFGLTYLISASLFVRWRPQAADAP